MRFLVAIVSFTIALGLIGLGIAQRTIFVASDRVTSQSVVEKSAPITIIDGDALNALDGRQRVSISGGHGGEVFAATGRTTDLVAWAGDTSYNHVLYDAESEELVTDFVRGKSQEAIPPAGSDLWLGEYTGTASLDLTVNVPDDISVIVLSDGLEAAPSTVAVTWVVDNRAPWSGPLLIAGVSFLLLGLGLYLWALAHLRKTRGPRRKPPSPPKQAKLPKKPKYSYRKATKAVRKVKPKAIERPRGRRAIGRMGVVLPGLLITSIVLSGCSVEELPDFITGRVSPPTPTPTETAAPEDELLLSPAVTVPQTLRIIERVARVAKEADAEKDAELAQERFAGAALEAREANYEIRTEDNSLPAPIVISSGPVALTLPQQTDTWPRTVFVVIQQEAVTPPPAAVEDDAVADDAVAAESATEEEAEAEEPAVVPTAMMLVQESPREQYKVAYSVALEANATFEVAGDTVGAVRQDPNSKLLTIPPGELAEAYADVMLNGEESEFYELFEYEGDALLPGVGAEAKETRKTDLPKTAFEFSTAAGVQEPIAMSTSNTGAIVAVSTTETEVAKPKEKGSILSPADSVKALSGVTKTKAGITTTYSFQLLFYVPPAASQDKIVLLGFATGLTSAKEL